MSSTALLSSTPRRSIRIKRILRDINCKKNTRTDLAYQADKSKPRKKQRITRVTSLVLTFDSLCDDVIDVIYTMFDSPRDLYNVAFCSKRLLSIVSYEHILRSAIFQQKTPAKTLKAVLHAVKMGSIYVPSISRLLRLVNGRRCERGSMCWGFDMIENKSSPVNFARPGIGLYLCRKCIAGMTSPFQKDVIWADKESMVAASLVDYSIRGLNQSCTEIATGMPVGPIITIMDLKQISHTHKRLNADDDEKQIVLEKIINERTKCDKNAQKRVELLDALEAATQDLSAYNKKRSAELDKKIKEQNCKRLLKLRDMHGILSEFLEDHRWADIALDCVWNEGGVCSNDAHVAYSCAIVYESMRDMINAPSSASRKRIKQAAKDIRDNFDLILESDFFSYFYLDENDELEGPLREYCKNHLNPKRMFTKFPRRFGRSTSCDFMDLIRQGKLPDAFFLVIHEHDDILKETFALSVEIPLTPTNTFRNYYSLASSVWNFYTKASVNIWSARGTRTKAELQAQGAFCKGNYSTLRQSIIDYMACTQTQRFLSAPNDQANGISRLNVIETMYTNKECHQHLLARNFSALRNLHRQMHLRGLAN